MVIINERTAQRMLLLISLCNMMTILMYVMSTQEKGAEKGKIDNSLTGAKKPSAIHIKSQFVGFVHVISSCVFFLFV